MFESATNKETKKISAIFEVRQTFYFNFLSFEYLVHIEQSENVKFTNYYQKKWKSSLFHWVFAYRKNLSTPGANDTQASELTFTAIKKYIKNEFSQMNPKYE